MTLGTCHCHSEKQELHELAVIQNKTQPLHRNPAATVPPVAVTDFPTPKEQPVPQCLQARPGTKATSAAWTGGWYPPSASVSSQPRRSGFPRAGRAMA